MLQAVAGGLPPPGNCPKPKVDVIRHRKSTYTILQEAQFLRFKAMSCQAWVTRLNMYCRVYTHQTMVGNLVRVEEPLSLTVDDCRKLIEDGQLHYAGMAW